MGRSTRWTALDAATDIFRVKQYFGVALELQEWARTVRADASFVDVVRRALLPLPGSGPPRAAAGRALPPFRSRPLPELDGRRLAVVASGGSGALACLVGVARAVEEAGATVACWSLCSGGTAFGYPLAAGLTADEVETFVLGLTARDLVDADWAAMARAPWRLGRGFTGLLRGDRVEQTYRELLGDRTLAQLPVPAYAPIWNVEENRLDYLGPRTHPEVTVARAVRTGLAIPPVFQPVLLGGRHWCDGGIVDILPVHPVLDLEPRPDVVLVVNAFHPPGLRGEDATGWEHRPLSILGLAGQARSSQHVQLARENLARLCAEVPDVLVVEPVPYAMVRGTGFYRQFVDPRDWPAFVRSGYQATCAALRAWQPRRRPAGGSVTAAGARPRAPGGRAPRR